MACLQSQRETIFAEERWKTIPWSDSHVQKQQTEYLIDIFADLPTALSRRTSNLRTTGINSIIQRLQWWQSTMLQGSTENHVGNFSSHALYLAVCMIALHAGFPSILGNEHGAQCASVYTATPRNLVAVQPSTDILLGDDKILHLYHTLLTDACSIARLYASCKGTTPPPAEILVSLRQVWRVTRHIDCPLAIDFGAVMTQIMGDSTAKLPLFLYTP